MYRSHQQRFHSVFRQSLLLTLFLPLSLQLPNVKDKDRADEVMEKDLKLSADQLAQARRQRLRDLYAAEMLGWQAELAAKGLAIEIRKD